MDVAEWFVRDVGLVPGLASFNAFMNGGLQAVVEAMPPLVARRELRHEEGELHVVFDEFTLKEHPVRSDGERLFPSEALTTKDLYGVPMHVLARATLHRQNEDPVERTFEFLLMHLPVMVRSEYCSLNHAKDQDQREPKDDPGGYFIVNGQERVLVTPERGAFNILHRETDRISVRSARAHGPASWVTLMYDEKTGEYMCECTLFAQIKKKTVPLMLVFAALGAGRERMPHALRTSTNIPSQHAALYQLSRTTKNYHDRPLQAMLDALHTLFLPHTTEPLVYLTYMFEELQRDGVPNDDRDSMGAKTVYTTHRLMAQLVRHALNQYMDDVKKAVHVKLGATTLRAVFDSLHTIFRARTCTAELVRAFTRDQWPPKRTGVSNIVEILHRHNILDLVSHVRRLRADVHENNHNIALRQIHLSQYGFVCPSETPESPRTTGIVKHLALLTMVSEPRHQLRLMFPHTLMRGGTSRVLVNGHIIDQGRSQARGELVRQWFVYLRRTRRLAFDVSVHYASNTVHIRSDEGRLIRALLIVPHGCTTPNAFRAHLERLRAYMAIKNKFMDLVQDGWVEFVDANEQMHNTLIAETADDVRPGVTHAEVSPAALFGVTANYMPWANCNQGPRATYFSNMAKQLVGRPFLGRRTGDTLAYHLNVVQRAICATAIERFMERVFDTMPMGQTMVVAICCYGGYNQDDSIMASQKAVDLGALRMTTLHTYKIILQPHQQWKPAPPTATRYDAQGFIMRDEFVQAGDVLAYIEGAPGNYVLPPGARGRVHSVCRVGPRTVHVRVRAVRPLSVGDKTTTRQGQKGVVGQLVRPEDMPYSLETGMTPDLIINPHAFPSRMTMAYVIELVATKLALLTGCSHVDATSFERVPIDEMQAQLHAMGTRGDGCERLVCGRTGVVMARAVCMGPLYECRLKRVAEEQCFARARGPVMGLTRQPPQGRANDGAMRFGEMERDAVLAHGAPYTLLDRTVLSSDAFEVMVCHTCHRVVDAEPCPHCHSAVERTRTRYPFELVRKGFLSCGFQSNVF